MRVVAIRALHRTFVHAVLEGHRKLCSHGGVATVAEIPLLFGFEQIFSRWRTVNRVAVRANDVVQRVLTASNVGSRDGGCVTTEASIDDLGRGEFRESPGDSVFTAARAHVAGCSSMTTFAAYIRARLGSRSDALVVRITEEIGGDVRMAGPADITAHKILSSDG